MSPAIGFWASAAALTGLVLALLLRPLMSGRDPGAGEAGRANDRAHARERLRDLDDQRSRGDIDAAGHAAAVAELAREIGLADGAPATGAPSGATGRAASRPGALGWVLAAALPTATVLAYVAVGRPDLLAAPAAAPVAVAADPRIPHEVEAMVEDLRTRLAATPGDADGWLMLGRSYAAMNRLEDAHRALEQALALRPEHAPSLVAQAEVVSGLDGNRLGPSSMRLVERALRADPGFARALWLAGVYAFRSGDPGGALGYFERIREAGRLPPDQARRLETAIARARQAGGLPPAARAPGDPPPAGAVHVTVRLAERLVTSVEPGDTVFVYARAGSGPRVPLAVARHRASELPLRVTLHDGLAMRPDLRLSGFESVVVGARVSRSGSATPARGDLTASSVTARVGTGEPVRLTLDEMLR